MKLSKEKQQHILMVGMGVVAVVVGLYFTIISSQAVEIARLEQEIAKVKTDLNMARTNIADAPNVLLRLEARTNELGTIEAGMAPANDKFSWFVTSLAKFLLPYQNQVNIPHKGREMVVEVPMYTSFPYLNALFALRGDAHFHQLGRFMADVENKFPYFRMQRLSLLPNPGESLESKERLAFEMDLVTLVSPR